MKINSLAEIANKALFILFRILVVTPSTATFLLIIISSGFSFNNIAESYYNGIAKTQSAAPPAPGLVNVTTCMDNQNEKISDIKKEPSYVCGKTGVFASPIKKEAELLGGRIGLVYLAIVLLAALLEGMIAFKSWEVRKLVSSIGAEV